MPNDTSPPAQSPLFADADDVAEAWRPLSEQERDRAQYWAEVASRRIRRRWPDVDARIRTGSLSRLDPRDVVVALVLEVLGAGPVPGARSWSITSGTESRSVTLANDPTGMGGSFAPWMVEIFEGAALAPHPQGAFPKSGRYDSLFEWKDTY